MIYHVANENGILCGQYGRFVLMEKALDPDSNEHFNCVECHKILTGGNKHMRPQNEEEE